MCTINKSAHMKKSLETDLMILISTEMYNNIFQPSWLGLWNMLTAEMQLAYSTMSVLDMTLNHLIVFSSGASVNVEYPFIAIALKFTLTWSGRVLCINQIELFDHLTVCG